MSSTPAFSTPKSAMVFAAGFGKRMQPITNHTPKPLIEVAGKPMVEYSLDRLRQAGVNNVVVNTHHLADKMEAYLKSYAKLDIKISHENEILETGGGLVQAMPLLGGKEPFFVVNGDIICMDGPSGNFFRRLARNWRPKMDALLLLKRVKDADAIGYDGKGDFDINYEQQIIKKPASGYPLVFTGIQIMHPRLFGGMRAEPFSLSWLYSKAIREDGRLEGIYGLVHDGAWLHIGTPQAIKQAEAFLEENNRQDPSSGW